MLQCLLWLFHGFLTHDFSFSQVAPDAVGPVKNVQTTKDKNAPSPPPKDAVQTSRGPSNKQQNYAPRSQDVRSRDFDRNGTRFQNSRNEYHQGPRRMPEADGSKPASVSDAQVVNKSLSSGIPSSSERAQSFKASQANKAAPKKPFPTVELGEGAPPVPAP